MILFAVLLLLSSGSVAYTQSNVPEATRPYLELPFPGETTYEVTCGYGCYQHQGSMSYAVDFAVPEGDPILAAAAGTVKDVTWERGLPAHLDLGDALILYLDHGNGWFTRYVHLDGITVEVGEQIEMGDIIGYGGKTGASGAHLHFELKYGTSLHSASVPINELFDGKEPEASKQYVSNNWTLANKALAAQSLYEAQELVQAERRSENIPAEGTDAAPAAEEVEAEPTVDEEEQATQEVEAEPTVDEQEQATQEEAEPIVDEQEQAAQEVVAEPTIDEQEQAAEEVAAEPTGDEEEAPTPEFDIKSANTAQLNESEATEQQTAILDLPTPIREEEPQVPYIETELTLSAPSVSALSPMTATFTLRNGSNERLHVATLGVVARYKGEATTSMDDRTLFFDRSIVLNPGRSYQFEEQHTFNRAGDFELFIFGFDAENKLMTLQGADQLVPLHVEGLPNMIYLPLVTGGE